MLALEAMMESSREALKIFAPTKQNSMFTRTMIAVRTSSSGDFVRTVMMFAGTPMTNRNR